MFFCNTSRNVSAKCTGWCVDDASDETCTLGCTFWTGEIAPFHARTMFRDDADDAGTTCSSSVYRRMFASFFAPQVIPFSQHR